MRRIPLFMSLQDTFNNVKTINASSATQNYTALPTDDIIMTITGASGKPVNITLPNAVKNKGKLLLIKMITDGGADTVVSGSGTQTIDGSGSATLTANTSYLYIFSDGSNWRSIIKSLA